MDIIKTVAFVGVLSNAMISDKDAAQCTWNKPRERETRLTSDHLPVGLQGRFDMNKLYKG